MHLIKKNIKIVRVFEEFKDLNDYFHTIRSKYFQSEIIDFNPKQLNGYEVSNGRVTFGSSYGMNDVDIYYLLHEMGHFVSIKDPNKLLKSSYGLEYTTKVNIMDQEYEEPITWNAIKNELKAVAYQEVISKHITGKFPIDTWVNSFKLMSDFINVPPHHSYKKDHKYYDKDTNEEIPYSQREKRRLQTLMLEYKKYVKDHKNELTIDKFDQLWFGRVRFLEDNLNTPIREFWEWSKNSYGHDKFKSDSLDTLVNYNSQNGYSEEGQWVMTSDHKDVYIEKIEGGKYIGYDRRGNYVEGSVKDIIRTITRKEVVTEKLNPLSLKQIGYGTEGEVYSDGKFAYKVVRQDLVGNPGDIMRHYVYDHPNVVKIYDAYYLDEDRDYVVIKMELLDDLPDVSDEEEYDEVREELWRSMDSVRYVRNLYEDIKDPTIKKMVGSILSASEVLGNSFDIGFHNLMYDSKTGEYKQIDIT